MTAAAQRAHVGRGAYYYWLDRYAAAGEAGLAEPRSCAPHQPRWAPLSAAVCAEMLAYYDAHPHKRGCRTLAERLRQAHDGQAVLGPSKVAEISRLTGPPASGRGASGRRRHGTAGRRRDPCRGRGACARAAPDGASGPVRRTADA